MNNFQKSKSAISILTTIDFVLIKRILLIKKINTKHDCFVFIVITKTIITITISIILKIRKKFIEII